MNLHPIDARPAPRNVLIKKSVEATKLVNATGNRIVEHHGESDSCGIVGGIGQGPGVSSAIPEPGIAQIVVAVKAAEQNHFPGSPIKTNARGSTWRGSYGSGDLRPLRAIPRPR